MLRFWPVLVAVSAVLSFTLAAAAVRGWPPCLSLEDAIWHHDLEEVRRNIKWGADVNGELMRADAKPIPPLALAAYLGHDDTVAMLISSGANVNGRDPEGYTALHYATFQNSCEVIRVLAAHGAAIDAKNQHGGTPLHSAIAAARKTGAFEAPKLLIDLGADVNARLVEHRQTVLHMAILRGDLRSVRFLVAHGADVNSTDAKGVTPLNWARACGHEAIVEFLASEAEPASDREQ